LPGHISNGWPFSADTGPEIKNIYVTTNYYLHILLFVSENSNIRKRRIEKIEIRSNLHYSEMNTANKIYFNPL
jgi:hypothetical protein